MCAGEIESELLWYRHPEGDPFASSWQGTVLNHNVADTNSVLVELGGQEVLFTVGFYTQTLAVHWSNHPQGLWADPADVSLLIKYTVYTLTFYTQILHTNPSGTLVQKEKTHELRCVGIQYLSGHNEINGFIPFRQGSNMVCMK